MSAGGGAIDVFWTGGFDSTFRVLQAVIVEARRVQPHYLVDPRRRSTAHERQACARIRAALEHSRPEAAARLAPTRVTALADLPPDPEATRLFRLMKGRWNLANQFEWLRGYADHAGLDAVEVAWEALDEPCNLIGPVLQANVEGAGHDCRLRERLVDPEVEVMRPFRLPVLHLSRLDMVAIARAEGFADLLDLTWFCHDPEGGRPCGDCVPCEAVLTSGLGHRLPPWRRLRLRWRKLVRASPSQRRKRRYDARRRAGDPLPSRDARPATVAAP